MRIPRDAKAMSLDRAIELLTAARDEGATGLTLEDEEGYLHALVEVHKLVTLPHGVECVVGIWKP